MKVLMVGSHPGPGTGGVATAVSNLCVHLVKLKDNEIYQYADNICCNNISEWQRQIEGYHIYTPLCVAPGNIADYARAFGLFKIILFYLMNRIYTLRGDTWNRSIHSYRFSNHFLYLKRIIDFVRPDLIHAHHAHSRPLWSWLACEGKTPIITTLHSFHALLGASSKERQSKEEIFRKNFAISSRLIAVSDFVREQAIELGAEPAKIVVIPNGIETERFSPENMDRAREKLGLNNKLKYVLFVGILSRRKSVDVLIRAFAKVCRLWEGARLLIVGDGEERPNLQKLTTSLGLNSSVVFLGNKTQDILPAFYSASDLFVSVPSDEAQGIVFLEAMSCAKPCIGSRVGGIPMMVKEGETGFLVDYGDINGLADRIERLLQSQDLADRMGKKARDFAVQNFSWRSLTRQTYKLYAEVVKGAVK